MVNYFPISEFYKRKFGEKVWKIPVSISETCPNREGLKGMSVCNFCDVWGSAAYPEFRELELRNQIENTRAKLTKRYNAHKFLVYFQSYTSTFSRVDRLKKQFDIALEYEDVCGAVTGTRPDCISDAALDFFREYSAKTFVAIELGVQSFNEDQLIWMSRGHTAVQSEKAIYRIHQKCPDVDLGIHLMFGLPNETDEQIVETAQKVNSLPINNVKLHNLHVLKDTPLEQTYLKGEFEPISRELYTDRVILFLRHLKKEIAVHRLTAVASRHEEIVAPQWVGNKMASYQYVLDKLVENDAHQGQYL